MNNRYREEEKSEIKIDDENQNDDLNEEVVNTENAPAYEEVEQNEENNESDDVKITVHEKKSKAIKKLEEKINTLKKENDELKNQYLRTLADTDNFKKRIDEERIKERKYGSQRLLEKLVSSLDIFDKAVNMQTDDPTLKNFLIGFQMINNNINTVLEEEGVKKIKNFEKFDPRYHHAMEVDYDETKDEGTILQVIKDGYMYKDRVLVAALVKVNKKPTENNCNNNDNCNCDCDEDK